jgi:hypothetical protein
LATPATAAPLTAAAPAAAMAMGLGMSSSSIENAELDRRRLLVADLSLKTIT